MKNVSIGILLAGFMMISLFTFSQSWIDKFSGIQGIDPQISGINSELNETMNVMYAQSQTDSKTIEDSKVYSGSVDVGVISTEPYTVLKSNIKLSKVALNTTKQISQLGIIPDWVITLGIAIFILTLTFLALNAIFRTKV